MDKTTLALIDSKVFEILNGIQYNGDSMVDTNAVTNFVENKKNIKINFFRENFDLLNKKLGNVGAFMFREKAQKSDEKDKCTIVLNTKHNVVYQRFSLAHEIGHLVLEEIDFLKEGKALFSTHIDYKLFNISEENIEDNEYLLNEQKANIFALKLLIPENSIAEIMNRYNNIDDCARFFGVERAAFINRIKLMESK